MRTRSLSGTGLKISLPGEPIRRISPTFSKYGTYDSQKPLLHAAKFQVLDQIRKYTNLPFSKTVPIEIEIHYFFDIPKGKGNLFQWGLLDHIDTPDMDNLCKFMLDVLKKTVFEDDRQVNSMHAFKYYSENPRTEIEIMPKKPLCDDKVKEVLSIVDPESFKSLASIFAYIGDSMQVGHDLDYEETAMLILQFAEKYAEPLKKLNKKFPGLAKVLEERMKEK